MGLLGSCVSGIGAAAGSRRLSLPLRSSGATRLWLDRSARNARRGVLMAPTRRKTFVARPTAETIAAAGACLRAGGLVAMPTETVYGLAADATSDRAVAGVFAAKGRPQFNPLIAHVLDTGAARLEGVFSVEAEKLAEAFWPGPMTLVLPAASGGR